MPTANPPTAEEIAALAARPVCSIDGAAVLAGLSRSTIIRAIADGDLAASKVGGRVLIPMVHLHRWLGLASTDQVVAS